MESKEGILIPPTGTQCSEETRKKMSAAHKGVPRSEYECKQISIGKLGHTVSEDTKRKISVANSGKYHSEEWIKKAQASRMKTINTQEHKTKFKEAMRKRFSRPTERKKFSDAAAKNQQDPIYRGKVAQAKGNGFWYGAVRYYDDVMYCEKFNTEFKERVREYRGRVCFECGSPENGTKHAVHHVHYDKKMCCNGSPQDVVPLCRSCHTKTNTNRDYWEDHFTELIYKMDINGKCFLTREEMACLKLS